MYTSIISIYLSIIPLAGLSISWIINQLIIKNLEINSALKSAFLFLITVFFTYMFIRIMNQDSILILIIVISTSLALILLLFKYRKYDLLSN